MDNSTLVGGTMHYALGKGDKTAPEDENAWSTDIPKSNDAGTYYVWYKVVGDDNYNDTEPACVKVTIEEKADDKDESKDDKKDESKDDKQKEKEVNKYKNEWVKGQWYDANGKTDYKPQGSWKQNDDSGAK